MQERCFTVAANVGFLFRILRSRPGAIFKLEHSIKNAGQVVSLLSLKSPFQTHDHVLSHAELQCFNCGVHVVFKLTRISVPGLESIPTLSEEVCLCFNTCKFVFFVTKVG